MPRLTISCSASISMLTTVDAFVLKNPFLWIFKVSSSGMVWWLYHRVLPSSLVHSVPIIPATLMTFDALSIA